MFKRVMSRFSAGMFLYRSTEKFCRGTFLCCVAENFRQRKSSWIKGGSSKIFSRYFVVSKNRKTCRGTLLCCVSESFRERISLWMRRGRGSIKVFRRKMFVSQCRKIWLVNPSVLCFSKFPVAKKFMDKRGGSFKIFRRNFFVSQCRKFPQGILYCCFNFGYRKSLDKRGGGGYQDFPSKFFCLTVPKIFVGEPFSVSLISGIEKFYASEGYVKSFHRKFFVSQYRNISQRNPSVLCSRKFLVAKKFMDKREGEVSRFCFENYLSHSAEKNRRGTFQGVTDFGYRKILCLGGLSHDFLSNFCCLSVPKNFAGEPFCAVLQKISGREKVHG